jgi:hypothetical protein
VKQERLSSKENPDMLDHVGRGIYAHYPDGEPESHFAAEPMERATQPSRNASADLAAETTRQSTFVLIPGPFLDAGQAEISDTVLLC